MTTLWFSRQGVVDADETTPAIAAVWSACAITVSTGSGHRTWFRPRRANTLALHQAFRGEPTDEGLDTVSRILPLVTAGLFRMK